MSGSEFKFRKSMENMSISDLHALYIFIAGDFNKQFGQKVETKKIVHARYKIVEEELNKRAYGVSNLYDMFIEGETPESIDLDKFDDKNGE